MQAEIQEAGHARSIPQIFQHTETTSSPVRHSKDKTKMIMKVKENDCAMADVPLYSSIDDVGVGEGSNPVLQPLMFHNWLINATSRNPAFVSAANTIAGIILKAYRQTAYTPPSCRALSAECTGDGFLRL